MFRLASFLAIGAARTIPSRATVCRHMSFVPHAESSVVALQSDGADLTRRVDHLESVAKEMAGIVEDITNAFHVLCEQDVKNQQRIHGAVTAMAVLMEERMLSNGPHSVSENAAFDPAADVVTELSEKFKYKFKDELEPQTHRA